MRPDVNIEQTGPIEGLLAILTLKLPLPDILPKMSSQMFTQIIQSSKRLITNLASQFRASWGIRTLGVNQMTLQMILPGELLATLATIEGFRVFVGLQMSFVDLLIQAFD
jgi:hypothetical protein